jgi:hypothetical protein
MRPLTAAARALLPAALPQWVAPAPGARDDRYAGAPSFRTIAAHMRAALAAHFPPGCGVDVIGLDLQSHGRERIDRTAT